MTLDPWSSGVFAGSPLVGFRDLLDIFVQYRSWPTLAELEAHWLVARDVRAANGDLLRLVAQPPKSRRARPRSRDSLYDVSVSNGWVPTRANQWHDFFNVMMFAAFPQSKRLIHARQRAIIERALPSGVERLPGVRTPEQDELAMLDEGGVLLATDSDVHSEVQLLLDAGEHRGVTRLVQAGHVRPWLIGHAHAEHLAKQIQINRHATFPRAKPVLLDIGAYAMRERIDLALAAMLIRPAFCAARDGRRAIGLEDLFLDLRCND